MIAVSTPVVVIVVCVALVLVLAVVLVIVVGGDDRGRPVPAELEPPSWLDQNLGGGAQFSELTGEVLPAAPVTRGRDASSGFSLLVLAAEAEAAESNRVELTHTRYTDGRVVWAVRGPGCGTSRWNLGTTDEAIAALQSALAVITAESPSS